MKLILIKFYNLLIDLQRVRAAASSLARMGKYALAKEVMLGGKL
jgi:hypothetical protein